MNCKQCACKHVCSTFKSMEDIILDDSDILDITRADEIYSSTAEICEHFNKEEED